MQIFPRTIGYMRCSIVKKKLNETPIQFEWSVSWIHNTPDQTTRDNVRTGKDNESQYFGVCWGNINLNIDKAHLEPNTWCFHISESCSARLHPASVCKLRNTIYHIHRFPDLYSCISACDELRLCGHYVSDLISSLKAKAITVLAIRTRDPWIWKRVCMPYIYIYIPTTPERPDWLLWTPFFLNYYPVQTCSRNAMFTLTNFNRRTKHGFIII